MQTSPSLSSAQVSPSPVSAISWICRLATPPRSCRRIVSPEEPRRVSKRERPICCVSTSVRARVSEGSGFWAGIDPDRRARPYARSAGGRRRIRGGCSRLLELTGLPAASPGRSRKLW